MSAHRRLWAKQGAKGMCPIVECGRPFPSHLVRSAENKLRSKVKYESLASVVASSQGAPLLSRSLLGFGAAQRIGHLAIHSVIGGTHDKASTCGWVTHNGVAMPRNDHKHFNGSLAGCVVSSSLANLWETGPTLGSIRGAGAMYSMYSAVTAWRGVVAWPGVPLRTR